MAAPDPKRTLLPLAHGQWSKRMLEGLLDGERPSVVFRRLLATNPALGNIQLSELLQDEFPDLTGEAVQLVWHWKGSGKLQGLSDENLDALIGRLLDEAGYIRR